MGSNFKLLVALNYNAIITILNIVFGFFTNILLVHQLGLSDFGGLSMVIVYSTVIYSISVFGLGSTLVHKFIHYRQSNIDVKPLIFFLFVFVQIIAILVLLLLKQAIIFEYFEIRNSSYIILLVFIQTLIGFPVNVFTAYFESIQSLKIVFIANVVSISFKFVGILCISVFPKRILAAILVVYVIPNITSFILLGFSFMNDYLKSRKLIKSNNFKELKNILSFSVKLLPVIFAELILANFVFVFFPDNNNVETLAVIRILLGFFTMALTLPAIIGRTMLPFFSSLVIESKLRMLSLYNSVTLKISFLFFCFITTALILLTKEVLSLYKVNYVLYQNWYFLIVVMILLMFSSFQGSILIAISKPQYVSLILITGAILHVFIGYILYPYLSVFGLLFSLCVAYFIMQMILNIILFSRLRHQFSYKLVVIFLFTVLIQFTFKIYFLEYYLIFRLLFSLIYLVLMCLYVNFYSFFNVRERAIVKFFISRLYKKLI